MPDQLTPDQKKARRAEINRQNAQKSTGPKSPAGKAVTRLNGLKNGCRAIVINLSHAPGIALLTGEDAAEYQDMVAEYHHTLAPTNRLEVGIVQRLIDAQWRLLRNSRLQSLEIETCLDSARENQYPGLTPAAAAEMHAVVANRMSADAKYTRQLIREEAALMRLIHASHRELQAVRKLNPSANPPVFPRLEYTGKKQSILDRALAATETPEQPQPVANAQETTPTADDQSQPAGWCYAVEPVAPAAQNQSHAVTPAPPATSPAPRAEISQTPQTIQKKQQTDSAANDQSQPEPKLKTFTAGAASLSSHLDPV